MRSTNEAGVTGIYHIHSSFSYDGSDSLKDIATWGKSHGLRFVLLTEHDLGFDEALFKEYCAECSKNSDDVLLVPGIEYEVVHGGKRIHVGAIGLPALLDSSVVAKGLLALVDAIQSHGGLAILHHPHNIRRVLTQEHIEAFDLIELWNTKFDCGFGPNHQFCRWLQGVDCHGPFLVSADIHRVDRFDQHNIAFVDLPINPTDLQIAAILDCLRQGQYRCRIGNWALSPDGAWQVPNRLYSLLPALCTVQKKTFRCAKFFIPEKYRQVVFDLVARPWLGK